MDNKELLAQIGQLVDERLDQRFKEQDEKMDRRFDEQDRKFASFRDDVSDVLRQQMKTLGEMHVELENRIALMIENNITRRLDALNDGFKLTNDKQWEQERKIQALQDDMDQVQLRVLALENRSA